MNRILMPEAERIEGARRSARALRSFGYLMLFFTILMVALTISIGKWNFITITDPIMFAAMTVGCFKLAAYFVMPEAERIKNARRSAHTLRGFGYLMLFFTILLGVMPLSNGQWNLMTVINPIMFAAIAVGFFKLAANTLKRAENKS